MACRPQVQSSPGSARRSLMPGGDLRAAESSVPGSANHQGMTPTRRRATRLPAAAQPAGSRVIGWTAWLARRKPTQLDQSAAMRRLTAKVERHTQALAKATGRQLHVSRPRRPRPVQAPKVVIPTPRRPAPLLSSGLDPILPAGSASAD
jgi:hypothetical protein